MKRWRLLPLVGPRLVIPSLCLLLVSASDAQQPSPPPNLEKAKALMQKKRAGEKLTPEEEKFIEDTRREVQKMQQSGQKPGGVPVADPKMVAALVPLDELNHPYKGEDGGLYGGGKNQPSGEQLAAYQKASKAVQTLGPDGKPSASGKIVMVSMGMSNTTLEFSQFVTTANADSRKSPHVMLVDGAQGGHTATMWALDGADALPSSEVERLGKIMEAYNRKAKGPGDSWSTLDQRLNHNGVTPQQVQVLWIKQAEARPASMGDFPQHARTLEANLIDMLNIAQKRFPNLKVAYLSSRIFAGYATSELNPEPYAYEEGFSMRWVIQDQMKGDPRLNADPAKGEVKAPVVVWGPYLWANGKTPRKSDGLVWNEDDLRADDHTHPSQSGKEKVANLLLKFFTTDAEAKQWFTGH